MGVPVLEEVAAENTFKARHGVRARKMRTTNDSQNVAAREISMHDRGGGEHTFPSAFPPPQEKRGDRGKEVVSDSIRPPRAPGRQTVL